MMTALCPRVTPSESPADGPNPSQPAGLPSRPDTTSVKPAQIGIRLINSTSYAFTYVTGVANTGAKDTSTPVPTSLPSEVYLSMTKGAAANGTMFAGCVLLSLTLPLHPCCLVRIPE